MTDQQSTDNKTRSGGTLAYALTLVAAAGIGLLAAFLLWGGEKYQATNTAPNPNQATQSLREWQATPFTLESLAGDEVSLADFEGRVVFLNFWGTWCEPCKREFPAFQQFMAEQPEDGPLVISINQGEDAETVQAFVDDMGITNLVILMDYNLDLVDDYPATVLPATFVVDGKGFVRFRHYGEITKGGLYEFLTQLEES